MAVEDIFLGPVKVWRAPSGTAKPDETTIAFGEAWGAGWTVLGYTKTPTSMNYETEELDVKIEESLGAVKRRKTDEALTIETTLAELTAANMAVAVGGTVVSTVAGAGQRAYEELEVGDEPVLTEYAWGLEGEYVDSAGASFPVRFFVHKGTAKLGGALEFGKEDYPGITLQVKALMDLTQTAGERLFVMQRVTAELVS
jgi:hypothetical protein